MDKNNRSLVFSILKCAYGWNGCTKTIVQQEKLDEIVKKHECVRCASAEMAGFLHDELGPKCFRQRLDGKPNTYSVERDRCDGNNAVLQ